jgi:hypothetical protein
MAVLSALVLIRALSVFHISLAFYFLTAPHLIADQNIVFILGESMHLVLPTPNLALSVNPLTSPSHPFTASKSRPP